MGNYAAALETQITAVHKHSKKYIEHTVTASVTFGYNPRYMWLQVHKHSKKYIERHRSLASSMTGPRAERQKSSHHATPRPRPRLLRSGM